MRLSWWPLALYPAFALGCAGAVSGAGAGDAEATTTSAIIVIERTVDPTAGTRAEASARFVRFAATSTADEALRAIGASMGLPARDTCASGSLTRGDGAADESAPVVELVDVGSVAVEADGVETRLVPRQLPDVTDVVTGVVYARANDPTTLPAATRYRLLIGGHGDAPAYDVTATAPGDPSDVRLAGERAGVVVTTGTALDVSWTPDGTGDVLYVDVQPAAIRCTLGDGAIAGGLAHASLPASLFDENGTIVIHRVHREAVHAAGLASGEIRFDFARSLAYARR